MIFCCADMMGSRIALYYIASPQVASFANSACLNWYFCQTCKILMADDNVFQKLSIVRKSGAVFDAALVPGRAFGPC